VRLKDVCFLRVLIEPLNHLVAALYFAHIGPSISLLVRDQRPPRRVAEAVLARRSDPIGWHAVKLVDPAAVGPVGPVRHVARHIAGRFLEPAAVEVDDESALARIVVEHPPGQRMVALAHAEETAERHDGVGNLPGGLIDHEIVHRAETLALAIIDCRSFDLVGGNEAIRLLDSGAVGCVVTVA
jgi:hypothetical protein